MRHWPIQPRSFPQCQINQENAISFEPLRCPKVPVMTLVAELRLKIFFDLAESKVVVFLCSILTSDGVPLCFGKNSFP